jgi:integrase/recombinase XerD
LTFNDIEGEHYGACPLGHDKLDTTARYARVATGMIAGIESPLDLLSQPRKKPKKGRKDQPPA